MLNKQVIKKIRKSICVGVLAANMTLIPVAANNDLSDVFREARWNNISSAALTIGFDANDIGYFGISVTGYKGCTGFDGQMCLYDENGKFLKSWAISDFDSPYDQERTYQCEDGKTYTVKFQGYAYGEGRLYDDIELSVTDTCE